MFKRLAILAGTVALWAAIQVAPVQAQQAPDPAAAQPAAQPVVQPAVQRGRSVCADGGDRG